MERLRALLLMILFFVALPLAAQDDFADDFSDFEDEEQSQKSDAKDDASAHKSAGFDGVRAEVSREDLEKLESVRKTGNTDRIVAAASTILGKDQKNLKALNTLALHYFTKKKFGLAKIILKRALKDHPEERALHNNLGIIYLAEGDIALALDAFRKSVSGNSSYRFGAGNLSSIFLEFGDYKRSLAPLEDNYKALRSDLGRGSKVAAEVANNYAVALMGVDDLSASGKVFREIMDSGVRLPEAYLNYAVLLVEGQNKKKDAISVISKLKFMTEDRAILRRAQELERQIE